MDQIKKIAIRIEKINQKIRIIEDQKNIKIDLKNIENVISKLEKAIEEKESDIHQIMETLLEKDLAVVKEVCDFPLSCNERKTCKKTYCNYDVCSNGCAYKMS